jgi:hypothetical protein
MLLGQWAVGRVKQANVLVLAPVDDHVLTGMRMAEQVSTVI